MKKYLFTIILSILLIGALGYIVYDKFLNDLPNQNNNTNNYDNLEKLDLIKLSKYKNYDGTYVTMKSFFQEIYNISLSIDGKVEVCEYGNCYQILNLENVVEMLKLSIPGTEEQQEYYFLLSNGNVYKYEIGKINEGNFNATKIDTVKNIKKIINFEYKSSPNTDDGTWGILAITKDNNFIEIASVGL